MSDIDSLFDNGEAPAPVDPQQAPGVPPVGPMNPNNPAQKPQNPSTIKEPMPTETGYITVLEKEDGGKFYNCNVDFFVDGTEPYFKLLHILYTEATEKDTVQLNIYSYGGMVETGCHIINGLFATKAHVITCAYGMCASIGAMMWACGSERLVADNATIMFHMPSGGCFGKTADNEEESRHVQEYFKEFMTTVAGDILTADELDRIVTKRNDLFIPAETIRTRLSAKGGAQ